MRQPTVTDYIFLVVLALIWASAFFNIKIATYSYGPVTIAFLRILLGAIPVVGLCFFKKIKIEAFSKDWYWFACNWNYKFSYTFFFNSIRSSKSAK
ncbi:MAG: EamA family transporter [Opitutales bacterium]